MAVHICQNCNVTFERGLKVAKYCSRKCYELSKRKTKETTCETCGKTFRPRPDFVGKYCSRKCAGIGKRTLPPRECIICHSIFRPRRDTHLYCGRKCQSEGRKVIESRLCKHCGVEFFPHSRTIPGLYCSHECYGNDIRVLAPIDCAHCGITFQPESSSRVYCSQDCASDSWRGDSPRSGLNFSHSEKELIKERDGYKCVAPGCGATENLEVDHIIPIHLGGERSLENGQTLCHQHHAEKTARERSYTARLSAIRQPHDQRQISNPPIRSCSACTHASDFPT